MRRKFLPESVSIESALVKSPLSWFPAFELDFVALGKSLGSSKELPNLPPFDPTNPF